MLEYSSRPPIAAQRRLARRIAATRITLIAWALLSIAGCAVNPVTGKRELGLTSERSEVDIGRQQFLPAQQMQGGTYVADPEAGRYLGEVGARVAAQARRKLPYEFVLLDNSVPNAWALPGGKIAVNRGLLYHLDNEAELAAVLAHEVVHADARHGARAIDRGLLTQGALAATAVAAAARQSAYAPLLLGGAQLGAQLITMKYGRDAEREADAYGMRYMKAAGYDPSAAVSLQEAFVRLSSARQGSWFEGLFASHPPSEERVRANRELLAELGAGGELGAERYHRNLDDLLALRAAHEEADKGWAALHKGDLDAALAHAEQALADGPQVAQFHELRGNVRAAQGRWSDAVADYNRAVERGSPFYRTLLERGLAERRLGDRDAAMRDLEASVNLLPTGAAMYALGELAAEAGQADRALAYFERAATAPGELGERARFAYARLDLTRNPGRYLVVQPDPQSPTRVIVENRAPVPVDSFALEFSYQTAAGIQPYTQRYRGSLAPGQRVLVALPNTDLPLVRVSVSGAGLAETSVVRE